MEEKLAIYCRKHPQLSRTTIIKKAQRLIHKFNYDSELVSQFSFSKGWFERFRERYDLKPKNK